MNNIGRVLLIVGVVSAIIGTTLIYSSLNSFTQCAIAPSPNCQAINENAFIYEQQYGYSASFYGLMATIVGAILYASAQVRMTMLQSKEASPKVKET